MLIKIQLLPLKIIQFSIHSSEQLNTSSFHSLLLYMQLYIYYILKPTCCTITIVHKISFRKNHSNRVLKENYFPRIKGTVKKFLKHYSYDAIKMSKNIHCCDLVMYLIYITCCAFIISYDYGFPWIYFCVDYEYTNRHICDFLVFRKLTC